MLHVFSPLIKLAALPTLRGPSPEMLDHTKVSFGRLHLQNPGSKSQNPRELSVQVVGRGAGEAVGADVELELERLTRMTMFDIILKVRAPLVPIEESQ
jgi:hypothetical protein